MFEIRKGEPKDAKKLAVLKQQVWISTYANEGITDIFSEYVLGEYHFEKVAQYLAEKSRVVLIAEEDGNMVGCADIVFRAQFPAGDALKLPEISTLYVLERFQGRGVGGRLLDECIREVKSCGFERLWLTVYYRNRAASDFYLKHGFDYAGETYFTLGEEQHKNYILIKDLGE